MASWKMWVAGMGLVAAGAGGMEGYHFATDMEVVHLGEVGPGQMTILVCPLETRPCKILVPKKDWDEVTGGKPVPKPTVHLPKTDADWKRYTKE